MTKKVFNFKKFIVFVCLLIIIVTFSLIGVYFYLISSVSSDGKDVSIVVEKGESLSNLGGLLEENGLIRSELAYKIYLKINNISFDLEYGNYTLNTSKDVGELLTIISKGSSNVRDTVMVTFYEGKNVRKFISVLNEKFNISEKEVLEKLNNQEYLNQLINDYWFIDEEIKNKNIYYSLEGYLFPDTYEFFVDSTIDDIIRKLLDNLSLKLEDYKETITKSKYSFHQILTLASIVEQEAGNANDRAGVAGVFYNRLKNGWSLGSDVTTYYAIKSDNFSKDLKQSEIDDCNSYNTRNGCLAGKLPVGPICNPSFESILAVINPTSHKYFYFVADKNGKTYFNKTDSGHTSTVNKLKRENLWIEYQD